MKVLDGLRGVAVLVVVWYHLWQISWFGTDFTVFGRYVSLDFIPASGFLGVELFFFISGFCLFYPYARADHESHPEQPLKQYAWRRFIKIVPSYLLAIFLILAFFERYGTFKELAWHTLTHLFFVHNLFPETYSSINGVFWSLGVEVQFYLVFPLVCAAFRRRPRLSFVVILVLAMAYRRYVASHLANRIVFFLNQLPGHIDLFAWGMLAAHQTVRLRADAGFRRLAGQAWFKAALSVAGAVSFALFIRMFHEIRALPHVPNKVEFWQAQNRELLGLVLFVVTLCSISAGRLWKAVLGNPVLVFLSGISYNLYIWHQYVGVKLMQSKWIPASTPEPHDDPAWRLPFLAAALALGLLLSTALTYGFERPLLRRKAPF